MSKKRRDKDFIGDIQEAMEAVAGYTRGLTYKTFLEDRKTQDAVVRNFEVMGEAAKNISSAFRGKYPDVPWKEIAGLRDKLIHFYFGIDYKIIWNITRKSLPNLRKQIKTIAKAATE